MTIEEQVLEARRLFREAHLKKTEADRLRKEWEAIDKEAGELFGHANNLVASLFRDEA